MPKQAAQMDHQDSGSRVNIFPAYLQLENLCWMTRVFCIGSGQSDETSFAGTSEHFNMAWMLQVVGQLAGKYSEQQVRQAVSFLADDGAIYSTIDDIHFKSCEGC